MDAIPLSKCARNCTLPSLAQWALENLLSAARRDVSEESTTRLSIDAFNEFKNALDAGMPEEARRLPT
ncbi:hypothetical protein B5G20_06615 [Collinsella sp. An7]|nr:hypothetical protein B5G20_06615 [Collinsella sp. An7]